jgi:hypothetical protein
MRALHDHDRVHFTGTIANDQVLGKQFIYI